MDKNGGGQHAVTNTGGYAVFPDWSPDGRKIAFDGFQGSDPFDEIYVVNAANGGGLTALTSCAGYGAGCFNSYPAWSPDGRRIVFIHADDSDADGNPINEQVWVMSANGSNKTQLTFGSASHDQTPDWSPDGRKIAYMEDGHIFTMRADGSHQTQLTFGDAIDFGTAWSPDGRKIAFVRNLARHPPGVRHERGRFQPAPADDRDAAPVRARRGSRWAATTDVRHPVQRQGGDLTEG